MAQRRIYFESKENEEGAMYTFRNNFGTLFKDRTEVLRKAIGCESRKPINLIFQNGDAVDYGFGYEAAKEIARTRALKRAQNHAERARATIVDKTG